MNELLENIFKLKNRKEIDTYSDEIAEKLKNNEMYFPCSYYLEAMYLYNIYLEAFENEEVEGYLYPYKLRKVIEIGNLLSEEPMFRRFNNLYVYQGKLLIKELDSILDVLIKYANINFLIKLLVQVIPLIKKVPYLENLYVGLGIMRFKRIELPPYIGEYVTKDYLDKCGEMPFYPSARKKLKQFIAMLQIPPRAKALYLELPKLYQALEEGAMFDFGQISLACFKIIEISVKSIIKDALKEYTNSEIYNLLSDDLKKIYKEETFKLERIEIGKIFFILNNSLKDEDTLSKKIRNYFSDDDLLKMLLRFINPENINKYRNGPAHGEYLAQELADEALNILDSFINEFLFTLNNRL